MPKPTPMARGHTDEMQTPKYAIEPLLHYIPKNTIIWEPACNDGLLIKWFSEAGYTIFGTDIKSGQDFFTYYPSTEYNMIITNPPFSLKDRFLERAYELATPFALLLPLTALESERRQRLYRDYGVQLILMNKRINFILESGKKSSSWFATAWFTYKLNLPHQLNFYKFR